MLRSWVRHCTLTVPLSTQEHKWVPANLMLGVNLRWLKFFIEVDLSFLTLRDIVPHRSAKLHDQDKHNKQ